MLDLFITHWTEPWEIGKKGFDILALQRCVDWSAVNVTLVHDGSEAFPEGYFAGYPFKVRQVCIPHGGIAYARNWCIDHSEAEWIKWNDFDDMFHDVHSVFEIQKALKEAENYDLLWFDAVSEYDGDIYIKDDRDPVTIHAKVFRRSFLNDHKIRFNEELTWCEDSAMLAVLEMEIDSQRIGKIKSKAPVYLWICREGSLCNRPDIRFSNLKSFFQRHQYVQNEFLKRGLMEFYFAMSLRVLGDSYFTLCKAGLEEDTSDHERAVYEYYKAHRDDLLHVSEKRFQSVLEAVNRENPGCDLTKEQFCKWLKDLRTKHERV